MAATENRGPAPLSRAARRRAARQRRGLLRDLPWIAVGVGSLAAREAAAQSLIDFRLLFYKEGDNRTQVLNPMVGIHQDLGASLGALDVLLAYDSISGASPTGGYPSLDVTTSASGHTTASGNFPQAEYKDQRKSASLAWSRRFGAHLPSVNVSYGKENDYRARSFGLGDSWTMAEGRGTLHAEASFSNDRVEPVTNNLSLPKKTYGYALGWTWILDERNLFDVSASLAQLSGYLDDPYNVVPIGPPDSTTTLPEHRPDTRSRRAVVGKFGHYYLWDGALKLTYRYYWDDWGVKAHTLEARYDQKVGSAWTVAPEVRLYTQSAASFYTSRLAAPQPYMSADYRLSPFWNVLGGLTLGRKLSPDVTAFIGASVQTQQGRDRVTLAGTTNSGAPGSTTVSAADMTVVMVTVGFTYGY